MSLEVGQEKQIAVTVDPENATNKGLSYAIEDTSVAEIDANGIITGRAAGTTTATLTSQDGPAYRQPLQLW